MNFYGLTDKGRLRRQNQDFLFASDVPVGGLPNLFMVADGMGGHNAGEVASEVAVNEMLERLREEENPEPVAALSDAVAFANAKVYEEAGSDPAKAGMGTTLVCAVLRGRHLTVLNIGDSRLYLAGSDSIRQISRDHSVVEELIRRGALSEEEAQFHRDRHKITRAVGAESTVRPDFFEVELTGSPEEAILLCSDGLTNELSDEELYSIIEGKGTTKEKVRTLIATANGRRGADNVTALLLFPFSETDEVDV